MRREQDEAPQGEDRMALEELLREANTIPGVEGSFLLDENGVVQASTLPARYPAESLASAARIAARALGALEASRRRVQEVEMVFAEGRLILRRIPAGYLGICCARQINRPLLDLALNPVIRSLTTALKERPSAPRRPRASTPRLSTVTQDLVKEGQRLVEGARTRWPPPALAGQRRHRLSFPLRSPLSARASLSRAGAGGSLRTGEGGGGFPGVARV